MPEEEKIENGRVTLAVLGYKIDNLQKSFDNVEGMVKIDHDRIGRLEMEMTDLVGIKRWMIGGAVLLIGSLITGVVILLQYITVTHP